MDERIKMVAEKAGVPEDKAKVAVEGVVGYLQKSLPPAMASPLDTVVKGADAVKDLDNVKKGLGGLFGKQ